MRIALLTDGITPYVTGGMQRHSFNLCRSLARLGVHVELYHCDPHKRGASTLDCFTEEERNNISAELIEFPDFGKLPGHYIRESYEYSRRIAARLKKKARVDFIYAKGFTGWELLHLKSKKEDLPPIGVNFHGLEMFQRQPDFRSRIASLLLLQSPVRHNMRTADCVFSYGGRISQLIAKQGIDSKRIIEIPAGVGDEWLVNEASPANLPVRILFVGRDERRKGLRELNQAIRTLSNDFRRRSVFSFIGPQKTGRIAGCEYYGEVTEVSAIRKIFSGNDVLVVPSYSEGMPNVILEAMSSGLAILASDVGAVNQLVDQENGWLIGAVSAESVKRSLEKLIDSTGDELSKMKTASLRKVKNFTWDRIGEMTLKKINQFLNEQV